MAIKTITVTEDAYLAVKRLKSEAESFSELFMRISKKYLTAKDIVGILKTTPEDATAFSKRVRLIREGLSSDMEKRATDVRSRLKRNN